MSEETGETASRGRPRPGETIERDEKVLAHLQGAGPQTRAQVATALELEGKFVYLSLYRLHKAGAITRSGATWAVVTAA